MIDWLDFENIIINHFQIHFNYKSIYIIQHVKNNDFFNEF